MIFGRNCKIGSIFCNCEIYFKLQNLVKIVKLSVSWLVTKVGIELLGQLKMSKKIKIAALVNYFSPFCHCIITQLDEDFPVAVSSLTLELEDQISYSFNNM